MTLANVTEAAPTPTRNIVITHDYLTPAAAGADHYLVNSRLVQRRVKRVYGIDSEELPPPPTIDVAAPQLPIDGIGAGFYLTVACLNGTPLEGAAFGRPSAAPRWGGYLDTLVEGATGVFFDAPRPNAIRAAVKRLRLECKDEAALQRHAERFSVARFVEKLRRRALEL